MAHLSDVGLAGDISDEDAALEAVLVGGKARQQGDARVQNWHEALTVVVQALHKLLHAHTLLSAHLRAERHSKVRLPF